MDVAAPSAGGSIRPHLALDRVRLAGEPSAVGKVWRGRGRRPSRRRAAGTGVRHAVLDAPARLGIAHIDLPLTPGKVWRAVRAASA